jgi:hypothetical protein
LRRHLRGGRMRRERRAGQHSDASRAHRYFLWPVTEKLLRTLASSFRCSGFFPMMSARNVAIGSSSMIGGLRRKAFAVSHVPSGID